MGGGDGFRGGVPVDAFEGGVTFLADDANRVDDRLGAVHGLAQGNAPGDVGREERDTVRQGLDGGVPGDRPDGHTLGGEAPANFTADKTRSACYHNHMAASWEEIIIDTRSHTEFVPVTQLLEEAAARRGWRDGVLHVFVPHTTAAVTIQEGADPDVRRDMAAALEKAVPWQNREYRHGEGNSAAHVKAAMLGNHLGWPMEKGKFKFGTWQTVYFAEFDGPRTRKIWMGFQPVA